MSYTGLGAGAHTFSVRAIAPGLKTSPTASKSWAVDLTPPNTPTVSQPGTPTKNVTTTFTFSSSSGDVQSYRCSVDGGAAATCTSPKSVTVPEGFHTLAVYAVDTATNVSPTKTVSWAVDTSTPQPFISSGPPTVTNATNASFSFGSTESGVAFTCALDSTTTYTACSSPKIYNSLTTASHVVRVRATDAAGNVATSDPYTWTVQSTAPVVLSWTNPAGLPAGISSSSSGTFAFTATGQTTLACRVDGANQASCNSPAAVSSLSEGAHTFTLVANSGLVSEVQLKYSWTVDTVAPPAPAITGPTGQVASISADITVTPGSLGDTTTCQLDSANKPCASPVSLTGLAQGAHTFVATATDSAGNSASSSLSWVVDTVGPVATVSPPTTLSGPVVVDLDEPASGVTADSVYLADALGSVVPTTIVCYDVDNVGGNCNGNNIRKVKLTPPSSTVPGSHFTLVVNPAASPTVVDTLGNPASAVSHDFRAVTEIADSSSAVSFTWRKVTSSKAVGKSYLTERLKGAQGSWRFSGKSVSWVTVVGPSFGKAQILVDGSLKATVNNYATTTNYGVKRTVKGLSPGQHTVTVRALGKKGAKKGTGTYVAIDAFKVGKTLTPTPNMTSVSWKRTASSGAADGSFAVAGLKGQSVKLIFDGTGVTLLTARGKAFGKAAIYIDGQLSASFDNYAPTPSWLVSQQVTGLADTRHTVVVKALGTKNASATGTGIVIDGFSVQ